MKLRPVGLVPNVRLGQTDNHERVGSLLTHLAGTGLKWQYRGLTICLRTADAAR